LNSKKTTLCEKMAMWQIGSEKGETAKRTKRKQREKNDPATKKRPKRNGASKGRTYATGD